MLERKYFQRAGKRRHRRLDHVQNRHARWHNSEGANGGGQFAYSVTYEFLFENCNSLLKGLLLPITQIHLPTESFQVRL